MFVSTDYHKHYVTKKDLMSSAEAGRTHWVGPELGTGDQVLRGAIDFMTIEKGLSVHYSNAEDLHDLKIETQFGPRLSVSLFLEGQVEASVGSFRIPMPHYDGEARRWVPVATAYSQSRVETFVRQARKGVRFKKVTISISKAWLFSHLDVTDPAFGAIKSFTENHLSNFDWLPSAHAVTLAEQIIAAPVKSPFQYRLYVAARVFGLLEEAFRQFSGHGTEVEAAAPMEQDRQKLQAIEHYLSGRKGGWVTAEEMSREVGMSQNSLQRLLSRSYGLSTSRFIRRFMLERAREILERDGATISDAAHLAGYSSPANFATAFKREFGLSPKQVV
ncbi:helix-turn-helix domain-containing protein [Roseibium aggregatum]|uniref:Helix-turn-helix transcriptional regulator n=1 Tax=Roseibium aggregatum TaxID=187304 RepID=A0A939EDQ8_9HYPH|nr:AraC family transcriptional regulator [Roseibium aggregatum]MBN9671327.1 helix-turn-helix transcriptional regulator [Roseibium aggregatum]